MNLMYEYEELPAAEGDCYEAAGRYIMQECLTRLAGNGCELTLVHGEVMGQGPIEGITFGHAWLLDGDTVIDRSNGRDIQMPRMIYYLVGQIDRIGNVHEYTWEDARRYITMYEHWGPWDLETESGL